MSVVFRDFIQLVEPSKLKEPLAKTLGAVTREFQDLWMERVKLMIVGRKDIDSWLKIDERRN
jgi:hypothetical protein